MTDSGAAAQPPQDQVWQTITAHGGVATIAQAGDVGIPERTLQARAAAGRCERPFPGIYIIGTVRDKAQTLRWAAATYTAPLGLVSHASAARWHELDGAPAEGVVEITVPRGCKAVSRRGLRIHTAYWAPPRSPDGAPVVSAARTLIDLAGQVSAVRLETMCASALHRRLVDRTMLLITIAAMGARPASNRLLTVWFTLDPRCESWLEQSALRLFRSAGLPVPELQWVSEDGSWRVDFRWPGLLVEVDGYAWHVGPAAFARDRRKANALAGTVVLRFTWDDIVRRPEYVVSLIRGHLALAS